MDQNRAQGLWALAGLACVLGLALGCGRLPVEVPPPVTPEMLRDAVDTLAPVEPGTLRFALAFGSDTDLDLGVTDPTFESVRFARPRDMRGGRFSADRGCGDPAPRVEIVEWKAPCPGRYEISIEHASDCGALDRVEPSLQRRWQLRIDHNGVESKEGRIEPGEFIPIVFEVEAGSGSTADCRP